MLAIYGPLQLILNIVYFVMIVHIIMSWLINFQVLNLHQPVVSQIWQGLTICFSQSMRPFVVFCRIPDKWIWHLWSR